VITDAPRIITSRFDNADSFTLAGLLGAFSTDLAIPVIPNPPVSTCGQAIDPKVRGITLDIRLLCLGCSGFGLSGVSQ
jgi:hypothetical protein